MTAKKTWLNPGAWLAILRLRGPTRWLVRWLMRWLVLACAAWVAGTAGHAMAQTDAAAALRAKHANLTEQLRQNPFKRPLVLDSAERREGLKGDIYGVVDFPFEVVNAALNNPAHWCDVMILHINTKYCHAQAGPAAITLKVNIGKKTPEALADAPRIEFNYRVAASSADYLDIMLNAKDGPMGTSDYRIHLEAVALPADKTFLHLTYAYSANLGARVAMQAYLATIGSGKVGFTVTGKGSDGGPAYIAGVRGLVERNTMRYFLAIDTYLEASRAAPALQLEQRLQNWFTAVEQYPRQLHEVDRAAYLEMKRAEVARQQTER
jgi:hypothetical protein